MDLRGSGGGNLSAEQISLGEFLVATAGPPRFQAKLLRNETARVDLHTEVSSEIGVFFMADQSDAFILLNRWAGGDAWSSELNNYTEPAWESVVLRTSVDRVDDIPTGSTRNLRVDWPGGVFNVGGGLFEPFLVNSCPMIFSIGGVLAYTTAIADASYEFLVDLELVGDTEEWRLKRSSRGPNGFTLARHEPD